MNVRIFISYSRQDAAFALGLQARLNDQGWGAWLDSEKLQTGQHWREEIVQAIAGCDYFVLVLSSKSIQSENVVKELSLAESSSKPILPLMIEPVEIPDSMKYQLAGLQFVSLDCRALDDGLETLIEPFFQALIEALPHPAPTPAPQGTGRWDKGKVLARLLLAIGPMAQLWLEARPDPLLDSDRVALEALFRRHNLDGALLAEALAEAQLPPGADLDPSLAEWFRLQVGPIADLVWDGGLAEALRQAPLQAGARLERIGVDPAVVQELLNRLAQG
ncbi:MAG: toll/interleukin-1 receptor domain-containing protein [Cyanobium sp.]